MREDYTKLKDRDPGDTLLTIHEILHGIGIEAVCETSASFCDGFYSNRIVIPGTGMGTNGKGTSPLYAYASGYAELMERIQNGILNMTRAAKGSRHKGWISELPDQKRVPFSELLRGNAFLEPIFRNFDADTDDERTEILRNYAEENAEDLVCVPFAEPAKSGIVWVPRGMHIGFYGSNGMSAGNTMEEAMVQGLCEILERYVNRTIMKERICPPDVPEDVLRKIPSLYGMIGKIEASGPYKIMVKDCSLGRGLPVVAVITLNRETGGFGIKFAAHPSLPIAIERTLTESFQGQKLEQITTMNRIGNEKQIDHRYNFTNAMKTGTGFYPAELLYGTPDYAYGSYDLTESRSNRAMLKELLELVRAEGFAPLARDVSFLGFPSCVIVIPGMSEMYPRDRLRLRENNTQEKVYDSFTHLNGIDDSEAERLVRFLTYREGSVLENSLPFISLLPLTGAFPGGPLATPLLKAACLYKTGRFEEAAAVFAGMETAMALMDVKDDAGFIRRAKQYTELKAAGYDAAQCAGIMRTLFAKEAAEQAIRIWEDPADIMNRLYPRMRCYDCERCEVHEKGMCKAPETAAVEEKIRKATVGRIPDQKALLNLIETVMKG